MIALKRIDLHHTKDRNQHQLETIWENILQQKEISK